MVDNVRSLSSSPETSFDLGVAFDIFNCKDKNSLGVTLVTLNGNPPTYYVDDT